MADTDLESGLPTPVPSDRPESVPWSLRASWIFTLLALPMAILVGAATMLMRDAATRGVLGLVLTEVGFFVPVLAYLTWRKIDWRALGFRSFEPSDLAIGCGTLIVTYSLTIVHNSILYALKWHTQAESLMRFLDAQGSAMGLVIGGVVIGPLLEEIVFRGFFFQGLRQAHGSVKAILLSSAVFAVAHLDPAALIPTFLLGCALAFVFDRSKSLWPGTILHVLVNAVGVGALLLSSRFPPAF